MKVVITGATGFIGQALVPLLVARGDEVVALSRDAERARGKLGPGVTAVTADLQSAGAWTAALAGAAAILHLAGEPVAARRWDARQRQVIRDSRVETTRTLVEAIAALPADARPAALISASGADYYPFADPGLGDEDEVTEADPPGDSFLARVCRDWEAEVRAAERLGVRVATMRTGLVLGGGGALAKMTTPFKLFAGGRIGSGGQWVSWIHRDDAAAAYVAGASDERYRGPINLVTDSVRNRDFARALGAALHRPSWLPVPGLAVKAAAGELAEYLLHGRRVVPGKLRALGFAWRHPALGEALAAALAEP
jgi:uncharacterized protein (TIGR01777 family)